MCVCVCVFRDKKLYYYLRAISIYIYLYIYMMMIYDDMPTYIYDYYLGNIKHMIIIRTSYVYLFHAHILLPAKVISVIFPSYYYCSVKKKRCAVRCSEDAKMDPELHPFTWLAHDYYSRTSRSTRNR